MAITAENAVRRRRAKSGYDSICRPCNARHANAWYHANHERAKARDRARYAANPQPCREAWERIKADPLRHAQYLERRARFRAENREQIRAGLRDWYARNGKAYYQANRRKRNAASLRNYYERWQGERARLQHSAWKAAHPQRWRILQTNAVNARRARLASVAQTLAPDEWEAILEYFGRACAYCRRTDVLLEQEHVIAIARGGGHTADNVVPACRQCNAKKRARTIFCML